MLRLERRGALRYYLNTVLFDDELMTELFETMHTAVEGSTSYEHAIEDFRGMMSETMVEMLAERYGMIKGVSVQA